MQKALILDANQRSALAATRSLGRRGVHVCVADETPKTLAGSSKYCRDDFAYPSPCNDPAGFIASLVGECKKRGCGIVFPMTDITTLLVTRERDALGDLSIPVGSFEAFEMLTDKLRLLELAQHLDVPVRRTYFIRRNSELDGLIQQFKFPVVLKPHRSRLWSGNRWVAAMVKYAGSPQELTRIVAEWECFNRHPFLVQEYVRGEARGIFALYDRSKPLVFFAHRRLREKPPWGGVSVLSESVEVNSLMCEMARRILDYVNWHGVAMAEFKVSPDGTPFLMEVNARFWGSLQLAIDAGVDFPWLLYQLAQGNVPDGTGNYKVGVRSRWLLGDIARLGRVFLANGCGAVPSRTEKWRSFCAFMDFFDRSTRYDVIRWDDPNPFLFEMRSCLRHWK